jgi:hypothetical protein
MAGEFLNGRMHGQGVHRWTTPALIEYDGSWHQGLMHGSGIVTKGQERRRYDVCNIYSHTHTHSLFLALSRAHTHILIYIYIC